MMEPREQWEYKTHVVAGCSLLKGKGELTKLGREGWEVYCVTEGQFGSGYFAKYHLKRRISQKGVTR